MNGFTIFRYLFGNARAVREVAENRNAVWAGMVLVITAAIARNYDQTYIGENMTWPVGSLLFSLFSGGFLFLFVDWVFIRRHVVPDENGNKPQSSARCFFGLFWMTAPIAWLYAIPVERFMDSYAAAQANLTLLAIVALWRVLLMARVYAVLVEVPFIRALGWVLLPACAEVAGIGFISLVFRGDFAAKVLAAMSGMRLSPERLLLVRAEEYAVQWAFMAGVVVAVLLLFLRYRGKTRPFPTPQTRSQPYLFLIFIVVGWVLIAIKPQREVCLNYELDLLLEHKQYHEALMIMSEHQRGDFAPSHRMAPDPYEQRSLEDLPGMFDAMDGKEAVWVRLHCLDAFRVMLGHQIDNMDTGIFLPVLKALVRIPEGKAWVAKNHEALKPLKEYMNRQYPSGEKKDFAEETKKAWRALGFEK